MELDKLHFRFRMVCATLFNRKLFDTYYFRCSAPDCSLFASGRAIVSNGQVTELLCFKHLRKFQPDASKHFCDVEQSYWFGMGCGAVYQKEGGLKL